MVTLTFPNSHPLFQFLSYMYVCTCHVVHTYTYARYVILQERAKLKEELDKLIARLTAEFPAVAQELGYTHSPSPATTVNHDEESHLADEDHLVGEENHLREEENNLREEENQLGVEEEEEEAAIITVDEEGDIVAVTVGKEREDNIAARDREKEENRATDIAGDREREEVEIDIDGDREKEEVENNEVDIAGDREKEEVEKNEEDEQEEEHILDQVLNEVQYKLLHNIMCIIYMYMYM